MAEDNELQPDFHSVIMTISPSDAPTHGGQTMFMSFSADTLLSGDCVYFVIFEGSRLRHITSTVLINPFTLQAVIPDHDQAEAVKLSVCQSQIGPSTSVLASDKFVFTLSSTYLLAQSLVSNCISASTLNQLEHGHHAFGDLMQSDIKLLDSKLASAFRSLKLPPSFRLIPVFADCPVQWTLLHFCAKHGLFELATYLMRLPGASESLQILDQEERTPWVIADEFNHGDIADIFGGSTNHQVADDNPIQEKPLVKKHKLGTTTLTSINRGGHHILEDEIQQMKDLCTLNAAADFGSDDVIKKPALSHPLETSLKRLREINLEIGRLQLATATNCTESDGHSTEEITQADCNNVDKSKQMFSKMNSFDMNGRSRSVSLPVDLNDEDSDEEGFGVYGLRRSPGESLSQDDEECRPQSDSEYDTDGVDHEVLTSSGEAAAVVNENNIHSQNENEQQPLESTVSNYQDVIDVVEWLLEKCSVSPPLHDKPTSNEDNSQDPTNEKQNTKATDDNEDIDENEARFLDSVREETEEDLINAEAGERKSSPAQVDNKLEPIEIEEDDIMTYEQQQQHECDSFDSDYSNIESLPALVKSSPLIQNSLLVAQKGGTLQLQDGSAPAAKGLTQTVNIKPSPPKKDVFLIPNEPVPSTRRRKGKKKNDRADRPLSDSFENIKLLQSDESNSNNLITKKKHRFFFFGEARSSNLSKKKSKSLDTVLADSSRLNEAAKMSAIQPNHPDLHGSTESFTMARTEATSPSSTCDSRETTPPRSRIHSDLSLSDVSIGLGEHEKVFVKSRSLDALREREKKPRMDEDRRKTIMGAICIDKIPVRRSQEYDNLSQHSDSQEFKLPLSYTESSPAGLRQLSIDSIRRESHETSDTDTDEGTSTEIADKVTKGTGPGDEKRKEKRFGLLSRSRPKSKKTKETRKEKDAVDGKQSKRVSKVTNATSKSAASVDTSKTGFLGKRGSSFRNSLKGSNSSSTGPSVTTQNLSDSKAQLRGSPASVLPPGYSGANRHSISLGSLRGNDRQRSPTSTKRMSVQDFESQADELLSSFTSSKGLSSSRTSLDSLSLQNDEDSTDAAFHEEISQYDSDLDIKEEAQTWSELVDKKVQRKMHAKDIKRQDVIYELILTESNYVRTLKIMSKIYHAGMIREVGLSEDVVETIFPRLTSLIEVNGTLLDKMKNRQENSQHHVMENIGDILAEQFGGDNGEYMKEVYGQFCSGHLQAVALYKELLKTDKKFNIFIKKCMLSERVRRLSIPECITLTTQRLTKYPLLIEAIIKATKESKTDYEHLKSSLIHIKNILKGVDDYVREAEKEQRLQEIIKKTETPGKSFKKSKLFNRRSQLIHDGLLTWKGKAKTVETRTVLLANRIIFLQEKDQKYIPLSVDQKAPVIPLKNLMVREVATDSKAIFLVSTSLEGPEIYELACLHSKDKKLWMHIILDAVQNCPDDDDEVQSDVEEELRREEEHRVNKLREIIEGLHGNDVQVQSLVNDKQKLVIEMRELIEKMDASAKLPNPTTEIRTSDVMQARDTLEAAINEAASLSSLIAGADFTVGSPSPSSSMSALQAIQPKRAETFGGFDTKSKTTTTTPPTNNNNPVSRTSSLRQEPSRPIKTHASSSAGVMETDSGYPSAKDLKNKRQSQSGSSLLSMLGKGRLMGSQEDLSSVSSSSSTGLLATLTSSAAQQQQLSSAIQLREHLSSLVGITSRQDTELASLRLELHEARHSIAQLQAEKHEVDEKLATQQKDLDRSLIKHQEASIKLQREFKRTVDKLNREILELRQHNQNLMASYTDLQKYVHPSNTAVSRKNSLPGTKAKLTVDHNNAAGRGESGTSNQDVIFF